MNNITLTGKNQRDREGRTMKTVFLKDEKEVGELDENCVFTRFDKSGKLGTSFDCSGLPEAREMMGDENYDEEKMV